ncbi:hypothetical protein AMTR_s00117p00075380 [Amborella trichopoda]|uniref:Uncharacterized protein n=1 Tax=Amborella trichopoda TaxID=13333 RepID=W1NSV7_AMBTC|nr:hypothetical protein AMTR_s00117p00075380 [Amborella trichopoda]
MDRPYVTDRPDDIMDHPLHVKLNRPITLMSRFALMTSWIADEIALMTSWIADDIMDRPDDIIDR